MILLRIALGSCNTPRTGHDLDHINHTNNLQYILYLVVVRCCAGPVYKWRTDPTLNFW